MTTEDDIDNETHDIDRESTSSSSVDASACENQRRSDGAVAGPESEPEPEPEPSRDARTSHQIRQVGCDGTAATAAPMSHPPAWTPEVVPDDRVLRGTPSSVGPASSASASAGVDILSASSGSGSGSSPGQGGNDAADAANVVENGSHGHDGLAGRGHAEYVLAYLRQRGLESAADDVVEWMKWEKRQQQDHDQEQDDDDGAGGGKLPAARQTQEGCFCDETDCDDDEGGGKVPARRTSSSRSHHGRYEEEEEFVLKRFFAAIGHFVAGPRIGRRTSGVGTMSQRSSASQPQQQAGEGGIPVPEGSGPSPPSGRRDGGDVVRVVGVGQSQPGAFAVTPVVDVEGGRQSRPGAFAVLGPAAPPSDRIRRRLFRRARDRDQSHERELLDDIERAIDIDDDDAADFEADTARMFRRARDRSRNRERELIEQAIGEDAADFVVSLADEPSLDGVRVPSSSRVLDARVENHRPYHDGYRRRGSHGTHDATISAEVSATAVDDMVVEASIVEGTKGLGGWSKRAVVLASLLVLVLIVAIPTTLVVTLTRGRGGGNVDASSLATGMPTSMPTLDPSARLEVLTNLFAPLSGPDKLATLGTAQNRALHWMSFEDAARVNVAYQDWLIQRYTLAVLYYTTAGDELWERQYGFLSEEHECDWSVVAVSCDADRRVVHIDLAANGLKGSIPSELANLVRIETLNLADNEISGTIPEQLYNATRLTELNLWSNSITGTLSTRVGQLTDLSVLRLEVNDIGGQIPVEIYRLTSLTVLSLRQNDMTGIFSSRFGDMTQLKDLALFGQSLDGTIPTELGRLSNLENLQISDNNFVGTIPTELSRLTNLWRLAVSYNDLTGTVPQGFRSFTKMKRIYFQENRLTGNINFLCEAYGPIETFRADLAVVACDCCTCCN